MIALHNIIIDKACPNTFKCFPAEPVFAMVEHKSVWLLNSTQITVFQYSIFQWRQLSSHIYHTAIAEESIIIPRHICHTLKLCFPFFTYISTHRHNSISQNHTRDVIKMCHLLFHKFLRKIGRLNYIGSFIVMYTIHMLQLFRRFCRCQFMLCV